MAERNHVYKIALIGDSGIGKTCLVDVFTNGTGAFSQVYITTHGEKVSKKRIAVGKNTFVCLEIWDLSGADDYRTYTSTLYSNMHGIMLCYSVNSQESWKNIDNWILNLEMHIGTDVFGKLEKLLVGLKNDLTQKVVDDADVVMKCQELRNTNVVLTSAKGNRGVQEAFGLLARHIYEKYNGANTNGQTDSKGPAESRPRKRCLIL